eukprot:NODE_889_length_1111_cov_146.396422_g726_i0.p1 GENE.NODE_889_length_1111_cov_146.396422_g726_i0~~NODE_889_length_1111_cov_146.396422_g726_i0.p1  ORF type:complete len:280 (+),score=20.17 NODE_889_length_1111_cov_146.396422_g726_i0:87-926(+)
MAAVRRKRLNQLTDSPTSEGKKTNASKPTCRLVSWMLGIPIVALASVLSVFFQAKFLIVIMQILLPAVLWRVDGIREKVIALSIDDVPSVDTPPIANFLADYNASATFFVVGGQVTQNLSWILSDLFKLGHELGNHLMKDEPSILLPLEVFEQQMLSVEKIITESWKAAGNSNSWPPPGQFKWMRPGSGWTTGSMIQTARRLGYRTVLGSVYPFDASFHWPALSAFHVLHRVNPGDIVILHNRDYTLEALKLIVPPLIQQGYRIVSISTLHSMRRSAPA